MSEQKSPSDAAVCHRCGREGQLLMEAAKVGTTFFFGTARQVHFLTQGPMKRSPIPIIAVKDNGLILRCVGCGRRLCRGCCFREVGWLKCPDCLDARLEYPTPDLASQHLPSLRKVEALEYPAMRVYALRCAWDLRHASGIGYDLKNAVESILHLSKQDLVECDPRARLLNDELDQLATLMKIEPTRGFAKIHLGFSAHRVLSASQWRELAIAYAAYFIGLGPVLYEQHLQNFGHRADPLGATHFSAVVSVGSVFSDGGPWRPYDWISRSVWQSVVCARRAALLTAEIDGQDRVAAEYAFVERAIASYRKAKQFQKENE